MPQESVKTQSTKQSKPRKRILKKTPKGLGDTVEALIPEVVKEVVNKIAGEDCGCDKRKDWLNKRFPYFKPLSDQDKKLWVEVLAPALRKDVLTMGHQELLIDMYERTYRKRHKKTRCGSCVKDRMLELEKAYEGSCE